MLLDQGERAEWAVPFFIVPSETFAQSFPVIV